MSFRVCIVAEDPTNDEYILKPLVKRILKECKKPNAFIEIFNKPRPTGYSVAKRLVENEVMEKYSNYNLILFLPDRDGEPNRQNELYRLEGIAAGKNVNLFCCAAIEEVEAWLLAGHNIKESCKEIRNDKSVKENLFEPFLKQKGNAKSIDGGRTKLMVEALDKFDSILACCKELGDLKNRICDHIQSAATA